MRSWASRPEPYEASSATRDPERTQPDVVYDRAWTLGALASVGIRPLAAAGFQAYAPRWAPVRSRHPGPSGGWRDLAGRKSKEDLLSKVWWGE